MIFLDSTVLSDYFNGNNTWQVEALDSIIGKELGRLAQNDTNEVILNSKVFCI